MKKWTQDEKDILRKYYRDRGCKYCAGLINRTHRTVGREASLLGFNKITIPKWTEREKNILRQYYPHYGVEYCSNLLHRSIKAIKLRAHLLGLRTYFRSRKWTLAELCQSCNSSKGARMGVVICPH